MRIEYVVTLNKSGARVTHRVLTGTGGPDGGGGEGTGGPDGGGGEGTGGPDGGGGEGTGGPDGGGGEGTGGPDGGGGEGTGGPDGGGGEGTGGPDGGGGEGTGGPDGGGGELSSCGCPSIIVMGPTVITGSHGAGGVSNGISFTRRRLPKTFLIEPRGSGPYPDKPKKLAMKLAYQEQPYWCWAAVGSGVRGFSAMTKKLTQCEVAGAVHFTTDCCAQPARYDYPHSLKQTLLTLALLEMPVLGGVASFNLIKEEIEAGRPIGVRIAWDPHHTGYEDGAHFVVIAGWSAEGGIPRLKILDPAGPDLKPGEAQFINVPYDEFRLRYQTNGVWVATYLVKGIA